MRRKKFRNQSAEISRQSPDAMWGRMWESARLRLEAKQKAEPILALLHKHSFENRAEISPFGLCGCFCCLKTFHGEAIRTWWDPPKDRVDADTYALGVTAVCPFCGTDAVLGDQCGYVLSEDLLTRMERFWFSEPSIVVHYSACSGGLERRKVRRKSGMKLQR